MSGVKMQVKRERTDNKRIISRIVTVVWTMVIFGFSLQPGKISDDMSSGFGQWLLKTFLPGLLEYFEEMPVDQMEHFHFLLRKGAHFTEYCILGVLAGLTIVSVDRIRQKCKELAALGYCIFVAFVDETIQRLVPERAGRIADVCLDSFGAAVGIFLLFISIRVICSNKKKR